MKSPTPFGNDFDGGLELVEIVDGKTRDIDKIVLVGRFMPLIPFEFGGTQKLVREDYPGASEPTVQVLGARESNMTIKGHMKTNKFKGSDPSLRQAAWEYQRLMDAMRIRGNLVRASLGDWRRYVFIEETKFRVNTKQNIEYDLTFMVVGFNPPIGYKVIDGRDDDLIKPNKDITNAAAAALAAAKNYPSSMPLSASDILNNQIGKVAAAINLVTGFVNGVIADANSLVDSAHRAIGLIKNARASLSKAARDVATLASMVKALPSDASNSANGLSSALINIQHLNNTHRSYMTLAQQMAAMQAQFAALAQTVPMVRALVKQGDTLQTLAMKYYGSSDNWKAIYDHNKLTSTILVVGSVLEIPKV